MAIDFERYSPRKQNDPHVLIASSVAASVLGTAIFLGSVFFAVSQNEKQNLPDESVQPVAVEQPKTLEQN